MEQKRQFDYKKLRSEISYKFDIELDETALGIVRIISYQQSIFFGEQNKKLEEAIRDINSSKQSLEVSKNKPKSQAFWFGFGLWGLSICTFILCACASFLYWESVQAEELLFPEKYKWYKAYYQILKNVDPKTTQSILKSFPNPDH